MKNLFSLATLLLPLPALAASQTPACQGSSIDPELQGLYKVVSTQLRGHEVELRDNQIVADIDNELLRRARVWTCTQDGVLMMVAQDPDEPTHYENIILMKSGDHLIVEGRADVRRPGKSLLKSARQGGQHVLKRVR